MKKILRLLSVFAVVTSITVAGEYTPGVYRSSSIAKHKSGFEYTNFVTMVVNDGGEIDQVYIDATFPVDSKDLNKGFSTKQLLGDSYGMKMASEIEKEWNEQADAIAAHIVENQGIAFRINDDKTTDDIAGATVKVAAYVPILEDVITKARVN